MHKKGNKILLRTRHQGGAGKIRPLPTPFPTGLFTVPAASNCPASACKNSAPYRNRIVMQTGSHMKHARACRTAQRDALVCVNRICAALGSRNRIKANLQAIFQQTRRVGLPASGLTCLDLDQQQQPDHHNHNAGHDPDHRPGAG